MTMKPALEVLRGQISVFVGSLMRYFVWPLLACLFAACGDGEQADKRTAEPVAAMAVPIEPPAPIPSLPTPASAETPQPMANAVPPADGPTPLPNLANRKQAALGTSDVDSLVPGVLRQTVTRDVKEPTDLALLPDGTIFVVERTRGLSVVSPSRGQTLMFAPKDLSHEAGAGMLAVAVDPQFERTRRVYVFMTSSLGGKSANRVVRLTLDAGMTAVSDRTDIVAGIAFTKTASSKKLPESAHLGGRLTFGPDGQLYIGTGDGFSAEAPQSPTELAGKVLRVHAQAPSTPGGTNSSADPRVVAMGFRDTVGLAFHPNHEGMVVADRGGGLVDEVIVLQPGGNGGWDPRCKGTAFEYCGVLSAGARVVPMNNSSLQAQVTAPSWQSRSRGEGLAAMTLLRGADWRQWNGALALAFDAGQRIDFVKIDANNKLVRQATLVSGLGYGFSAIAQGHDGLYVATRGKPGGEEIVRLVMQ